MFIKPFKVKSNILLKSSDKKKLKSRIFAKYPNVTENEINQIFPTKGNIYSIKLIISNGDLVTVYTAEKRPMFFELANETIYPTLYTLWIVSNLLPVFTTHPNVLPKLGNGADLMLPGVIRQGGGLKSWGHHKKGDIVAINLSSNKSACAVGSLARSSEDLYMSARTGVCVNVLHVFGDKLWGIEPSACLQIPLTGVSVAPPKDSDFPPLGSKPHPKSDEKVENDLDAIKKEESGSISKQEIVNDENKDDEIVTEPKIIDDDIEHTDTSETPDNILKKAFLTALKLDGKKLVLPLLTSTFYASHIQPVSEPKIDIKNTSYKKLTKFLQKMANEGFIVVKEEVKGVEKILSVNFEHPELVAFNAVPVLSSTSNKNTAEQQPTHLLTAMTELFLVTEETLPFFSYFNIAKDHGLESTEITKFLKQYILKNKLQDPINRELVVLDKALSEVCKQEGSLKFNDIWSTIISKLPSKFEMRKKELNASGGNRPNIQLSVANRKGNKKVTLVHNLEAYGIIIPEFAKACKLGVQASTTLVQSPHLKGNQLLVQGNQIRFIHNLLVNTYKISPKNITGLELAKKEPKKKN